MIITMANCLEDIRILCLTSVGLASRPSRVVSILQTPCCAHEIRVGVVITNCLVSRAGLFKARLS